MGGLTHLDPEHRYCDALGVVLRATGATSDLGPGDSPLLQRTDPTTGAGPFRCPSAMKLAFFLLRSAAPSHTARPVAHLPVEEEEAKRCWCASEGEILHLWEGRAGGEVAQDRHWPLSPVPHPGSLETAGQCPYCPQVPAALYPQDPSSLLLYLTFLLCFSQFGASIGCPGTWH